MNKLIADKESNVFGALKLIEQLLSYSMIDAFGCERHRRQSKSPNNRNS